MSMQILLVEDSPTQALRLRLILERDGLKVSVARDGREGLRMAPVLLPDTVVLDVNLPDLDGFQVCQALKDHPATHGTPVIMLTVKDRAADTLAGLDAGADAYIPKDEFAEDNLRQTLRDMGIL
jgi:DNA-binding response OmpR family regulator